MNMDAWTSVSSKVVLACPSSSPPTCLKGVPGGNTATNPEGDIATAARSQEHGDGRPPGGPGAGFSYGLSSFAAYDGATSRGRGGPASPGGRGGRERRGGVGGGGVAAAAGGGGGGGADGPRREFVTGATISSCGAMLASPRGGTHSLSPSPRALPFASSTAGATAARGASRGASRGRFRGQGDERGRSGGYGGADMAAAAGASSTHSGFGSVGVAGESSTAGRKRGGGAGGETICADGGEDGGVEKRCRTLDGEQQDQAYGASASHLHGGHLLYRQAQAGPRQVRWLRLVRLCRAPKQRCAPPHCSTGAGRSLG